MKKLLSFELKKISLKRSTLFILVAAVILNLSVIMLGATTVISTSIEMERLPGFQAIENEQEIQGQWRGYITDEVIEQVELEQVDNPEYWGIMAAIGIQEVRLTTIKSQLRAGSLDTIYDNVLKGVSQGQKRPAGTNEEVNKLLGMYDQINLPFYYDYYDGWLNLSLSFSIIISMLVSVIIVICISPVFSEEYSQKTDAIILTTKYGKGKIITAKLLSAFIFTTSVFALFALLNFALHALIYGLDGYNASIQLYGWNYQSPYNMTFLQLYLYTLGFSFVGLLFMTAITLFISSKAKSPFITVIIALSILYIPKIDLSRVSYSVNNLLELFPINIMNAAEHVELGVFYNVFGTLILQPVMMIFTATVLSALLLLVTYRTFKNHQA
ncbi:MAG: hypothetical protein RR500_09240 [Bacilli bacterium]